MSTFQFYKEQADNLIQRYNNADMKALHNVLHKHTNKGEKILDIGIGSSRELQFLYDRECDIWGIDPTTTFIKYAQERFPEIKEHFFVSSLPNLNLVNDFSYFFDTVMSIAVWMHLKQEEYLESVENIISVLKPGGKVILSYSIGKREIEDSRYFEEVNTNYLIKLFEQYNCHLIEQIGTEDGLGRTEQLTWVTLIFSKN